MKRLIKPSHPSMLPMTPATDAKALQKHEGKWWTATATDDGIWSYRNLGSYQGFLTKHLIFSGHGDEYGKMSYYAGHGDRATAPGSL